MAEIDSIPQDVLVEFSRRREQILERLASTGHAAQHAAVRTRERKETFDLHRLLDE